MLGRPTAFCRAVGAVLFAEALSSISKIRTMGIVISWNKRKEGYSRIAHEWEQVGQVFRFRVLMVVAGSLRCPWC